MGMHDVDGPNSGYAQLLLEDYLENPDAVAALLHAWLADA